MMSKRPFYLILQFGGLLFFDAHQYFYRYMWGYQFDMEMVVIIFDSNMFFFARPCTFLFAYIYKILKENIEKMC